MKERKQLVIMDESWKEKKNCRAGRVFEGREAGWVVGVVTVEKGRKEGRELGELIVHGEEGTANQAEIGKEGSCELVKSHFSRGRAWAGAGRFIR